MLVDKTKLIIDIKVGGSLLQAPYPYLSACKTHYKCHGVDAV
jgi:hypothetical protein